MMTQKEKSRPSQMSVRILLKLLQHPGQYNKSQLAKQVGISRFRIKEYLSAFESEGIEVDIKSPDYKISILPDDSHRELKNLLAMDDDDMRQVADTLRNVHRNKSAHLIKKLETLYDFQKLGLRSLRKPHLNKMDDLMLSIKKKQKVILKNYRSNSNEIKDRTVECIKVHPDIGTIQVFDHDRMDVRHFKLDRIDYVEILKDSWQYESKHFEKITDHFRIADSDQLHVHLKLTVKGYNLMVDTYPKTVEKLIKLSDNTFDYAAKVNHLFLGLAPFILANTSQITILQPPALSERVMAMAKAAQEDVRKSLTTY